MKSWGELREAESIHWNKLSKPERIELLKTSGFPSRFAREKWKQLDFRAKERMGKMINKTTQGEFALKEGVKEDAPLNQASGSAVAGLGDEPPVKKKRKRKKFAGMEVFEVTPEEYVKCLHGRTRYERWCKKFNMEDINNVEIQKYSYKYPKKSIIVQNEITGEMSYLMRR